MTTSSDSVCIQSDDFMFFVRRAVDAMAAILEDLGDDAANRRPHAAPANSPYALFTHCLGVVEYWGGALIAGRQIDRDRPSEFVATGPVQPLIQRSRSVLDQLALDICAIDSSAPLAAEPTQSSFGPERTLNQGAALLHLYEELSQHHGQMETIRDAITNETPPPTHPSKSFEPSIGWLRNKQGVKWLRPGPDLIPAWIADMDFPVAPPIRAALLDAIDRGDLGYPEWTDEPLAAAFADRMDRLYSWQPDPTQARTITDLIQAVQVVIEIATEPGDPIVAQTPNYPPFSAAIKRPGRRLLDLPMIADGATWTWDLDRLDHDLKDSGARVLFLVNPHNPTGHVSTRTELEALAEVVVRHDLIVISDEIHADLTYAPNHHIPMASVSAEMAARTITISSATKAFNIAGLRAAVAHIGPDWIRSAWDNFPPDLFGAVNVLGVNATLAAWNESDEWLNQVRQHLVNQRDAITAALEPFTQVTYRPPEASYLAWIDCRGLELTEAPVDYFRRAASVELNRGSDFGQGGEGFVRLNFATSRSLLDTVLTNMTRAIAT